MKKIVLAAMLGLMATGAPAGAFSLPKLFQGDQTAVQRQEQAPVQQPAPVILAQQGGEAVRIQQLQEQIRQLNGRIEEMSFQLLQMQEQMRKTQEDNEFRFQDLEKRKRTDLGDTAGQPAVASNNRAPAAPGPQSPGPAAQPGQPAPPVDDVARIIGQPGSNAGGSTTAPPPTTLGSIDTDASGNPRGATRAPGSNSAGLPGVDVGSSPSGRTPATPSARPDPQQTASLGSESDSYQIAYNHVLSGDYAIAEREFATYIQAFPKSNRIADANFWLGEAQYSQKKYNEAAKTFLNAHQTYAKSPKAAEMLLKLGMSLAALDSTDTACATLREVPKRYPTASRAVLAKATSEQKRLSCGG